MELGKESFEWLLLADSGLPMIGNSQDDLLFQAAMERGEKLVLVLRQWASLGDS